MPGYPIHANTDIWGPTAGGFDPNRFVNPDTRRGGSDFLSVGRAAAYVSRKAVCCD
jgi:hypothetical protein